MNYVFEYSSTGNCFNGKKLIQAPNLVKAQDKFLLWLKRQEVYNHLWRFSFNVEVVE